MQVPAYLSLGAIAAAGLQPAFPGAPPLIRWGCFPAVHLVSPPRRARGVFNLPAGRSRHTAPCRLPTSTAEPTAGPKVHFICRDSAAFRSAPAVLLSQARDGHAEKPRPGLRSQRQTEPTAGRLGARVRGWRDHAWPAASWDAISSTSFCSPRIGRTMTVKLTSFSSPFQRKMSTPSPPETGIPPHLPATHPAGPGLSTRPRHASGAARQADQAWTYSSPPGDGRQGLPAASAPWRGSRPAVACRMLMTYGARDDT